VPIDAVIIFLRTGSSDVSIPRTILGDWVLIARFWRRWCCQFCKQSRTINIQSLKIDSSLEKLSIDWEIEWFIAPVRERYASILRSSGTQVFGGGSWSNGWDESRWCSWTLCPLEHS
jgi:hypothetical protein